jgi:hypothetical protein
MAFVRRSARSDQGSEPLWWCLAAAMGLASLRLPRLIGVTSDRATELIVVELALLFSGALLGAFKPRRVWRWGAASLAAFALSDLVSASVVTVNWAAAGSLGEMLASRVNVYAVRTLTVLAGAWLGSMLERFE